MTTIIVKGEASLRVPAQLGEVLMLVQTTDGSEDDCSTRFDEVVDTLNDSYSRLIGTNQMLAPVADGEMRWRHWAEQEGQEPGLTYFRQITHRLTFIDFAAMNAFLLGNSASDDLTLISVQCRLLDATRQEAASKVRAQALMDATRRARDFASGEPKLVRLVETHGNTSGRNEGWDPLLDNALVTLSVSVRAVFE